MSYTPLRLLRETNATPAKSATLAKVGLGTLAGPLDVAALAALAARPHASNSVDLAERAAIIAEGAGVPVDWAEGFALLAAMPIPTGVSPSAWLAMMNAAGRFLDQWGAKAAALGWTAGELFGLDPAAPLNRRDHRGAALFLANAEVVAITAEAITLKVGGSIQSVPRREGFTLPAWETMP